MYTFWTKDRNGFDHTVMNAFSDSLSSKAFPSQLHPVRISWACHNHTILSPHPNAQQTHAEWGNTPTRWYKTSPDPFSRPEGPQRAAWVCNQLAAIGVWCVRDRIWCKRLNTNSIGERHWPLELYFDGFKDHWEAPSLNHSLCPRWSTKLVP